MTTEVILAVVNLVQVLALAWIASRQHQVKHELERVNGRQEVLMRDVQTELSLLSHGREQP
jgi:hypothetical protein